MLIRSRFYKNNKNNVIRLQNAYLVKMIKGVGRFDVKNVDQVKILQECHQLWECLPSWKIQYVKPVDMKICEGS